MFPATGPCARELYHKHMDVIEATANNYEICFEAANRIGKTELGAYITTAFMTGNYPDWWHGKRFPGPVDVWVAGDTAQTTKEIVQQKLLGNPGELGTGMIPLDCLEGKPPVKPGIPDGVDNIRVKHVNEFGKFDGYSTLIFKSYDQKRKGFQGTGKHLIWLDEEPPASIYGECLTRTMTTNGIVLLTFTPLSGLSEVVRGFMIDGKFLEGSQGSKIVIRATWDDAPHLDETSKKRMLASYGPHEIEARSKGIPTLGSGAIYPIAESAISVEPFKIPDFWEKWYGLDYGWKCTAAVFFARDPNTQVTYIYQTWYRKKAEPQINVAGIRTLGGIWQWGASDSAGINSTDGTKMIEIYRELGLNLIKADKSVEAGILEVWQGFVGGGLKVFTTCQDFWNEFRTYHKDENGKIVKENDHAMDAARYGYLCREQVAGVQPDIYDDEGNTLWEQASSTRNKYTGY